MYIYKTKNLLNSKVYIGKSEKEFTDKYLGSGKILWRAIKKYGISNFKVELIETCSSIEELNIREKFWISYYSENSYNLAAGGTGGWTTRYYTSQQLDNFKKNLSNSLKGRKHSDEVKLKLSLKNKNKFFGDAAHLSDKVKSIWADPTSIFNSLEYRNKLAIAGKKRKWSDETRRKISESKLGSKNGMAIQIQVDDDIYATRRECAKKYNISETAVTKRCLSKNFTNWKIVSKNN